MQAYAHILRAIADGEQIEVLEYYLEGSTLPHPQWVKKPTPEVLQDIAHQKSPKQFRVASNKKTISINGYEFPEPEQVAPEVGVPYYYPNLSDYLQYSLRVWTESDMDKYLLQQRLVHLTKEAAIQHTKLL